MAICPVIENLLDVKSKQIEVEQQLNNAREEMMAVSYKEDPSEWSKLFTKVTNISMRLADTNRELALLEHAHLVINNGVLPY